MITSEYNIQNQLDMIFNKIKDDYTRVSDKEITLLVELINKRYSCADIILDTLSNRELIRNTDYITRATYELTKRKGLWDTASKHYILSNLCKARYGLESETRRKIFKEKQLIIEGEIESRKMFVKFKFSIIDNKPLLLLKHIYGFNSIANVVEHVVKDIQDSFLSYVGYDIFDHCVSILYKDIEIKDMETNYDEVKFSKEFKNPEWTSIDGNWFEELWKELSDEKSIIEEPVFFENKKPYSANKKIKEILNSATKSLVIMDNYIDSSLFEMLEAVQESTFIKLLTEKFQGDAENIFKKFKIERGNIEARKTKKVHDRYIIVDNKHLYLLGSSINSFGQKATSLVPINQPEVKASINNYLDLLWRESPNL